MLKNYLTVILRNIQRHKGYALINLTGLTIGMMCFVLIALYVKYEFSFDTYHKNRDRIYRIVTETEETYMGKNQLPVTPAPLAQALKDTFPEVVKATRIHRIRSTINQDGHYYTESNFYFTDPEFLEIFTFPLIQGDPQTALDEPYSLLLTNRTAQKYFGQGDPIGKILSVNKKDFVITGILHDVSDNSHFHFDFLASFSSLVDIQGEEQIMRWSRWSYHIYLELQEHADHLLLEEKLPELLRKNYSPDATQTLRIQPLADIHFDSKTNFEWEPNIDIRNVYLFTAIALLILLIACFNYMNLSTARSAGRAKEVGLRKVIGAARGSLIRQFLCESILFSLLALFLSFFLVKLFLPGFGSFLNRELDFSLIGEGVMIPGLAVLALFVGLVAGSYPALFISSFQPAVILKGERKSTAMGSTFLRNLLVVTQFAISIALIFCSAVVFKQLHYIQNKELGYVKDYIVEVPFYGHDSKILTDELRKYPGILDVTVASSLPGDVGSAGFMEWEGKTDDEKLLMYRLWVDYSYLDFYGIELIEGRKFSREFSADMDNAYILNRKAMEVLGWKDPVGKRIGDDKENLGVVVGVVENFHIASLHLNIEPLAIMLSLKENESLSIKVRPEDISAALAFIEESWKKRFPERVFSYSFLDDRLERMYRSERKLGTTFNTFTTIAILVACLGLFGLVSFMAQRKTKEIGIRKVLGASVPNITFSLIREFLKLVTIAILVAWPIAYFVMQKWLDNFAYRTNISIWIFLSSGTIALIIALTTVSYRSVKAALANPIESLRYE